MPFPGDLPDAGIETVSLESPALASGFFTTTPAGKGNPSMVGTQSFSLTNK